MRTFLETAKNNPLGGVDTQSTNQSVIACPEPLIIPKGNVLFLNADRDQQLVFAKSQFYVVNRHRESVVIPNHLLPKAWRAIDSKQLAGFLKVGYFVLNYADGTYSLQAKVRGLGGGPVTGALAYWLTKSVCYGTAAAAATTVVVGTGGAAGAVTGALAAATTAGAGTATAVAGGAISGAGYAGGAATLAGATILAAGGVAEAAIAVESASLAAGAIFTAIPFLP